MKYLGRFDMGSFLIDFYVEIYQLNGQPRLLLSGSHLGGSHWASFGGRDAIALLKSLVTK
jgi:hypothetical protein